MTEWDVASGIARRLREAGYEALFAGGSVRDRLLQREPKDYDIATNATPAQVLGLFPKSNEVGAHFGVMLVSNTGTSSRSPRSARMAAIAMADAPIMWCLQRQKKMRSVAILRSMVCSKRQKAGRSLITWADGMTLMRG